MKKIELIIRGSNLPICPKCGNGNAMFDERKRLNIEADNYKDCHEFYFECRDCGFKVDAEFAELVFTKLNKPGMGNLSTYTEIKRVNGLDYF